MKKGDNVHNFLEGTIVYNQLGNEESGQRCLMKWFVYILHSYFVRLGQHIFEHSFCGIFYPLCIKMTTVLCVSK